MTMMRLIFVIPVVALLGCPASYAPWESAPDGSVPLSDLACLTAGVPSDPTERSTYFSSLSELGARWVRWEENWSEVEKTKGVYDFSVASGSAAALADAGVQQMFILDYGNPLYSDAGAMTGDDKYPPDNPEDFARFASAAVALLSGTIKHWEVWNEENDGFRFWKPMGNPAGYAALLEATYPAVKAACGDCTVLFGPTVSDGYPTQGVEAGADFIADARDAGASHFDALAVHPYMLYPPCSPPEDSAANVCQFWPGTRELSFAQQVQDTSGAAGNVAFYATEYGWPTFTPGTNAGSVTEDAQAEWLVRGALLLASMGARTLCWYTLFDGADETCGFVPEGAFGLIWDSGVHKRGFRAYADLYVTLHPGAFVRDRGAELGLQDGEYAFLFDDGGLRLTTFLWHDELVPARTVQVKLFGPSTAFQPGWGPVSDLDLKGATATVTLDVKPIAITSAHP
jgi:polysaccharide biosynthesis protein PslG